jgi:hypothetical protein
MISPDEDFIAQVLLRAEGKAYQAKVLFMPKNNASAFTIRTHINPFRAKAKD